MRRRRLIPVPLLLAAPCVLAAGAWAVSYFDGIYSADGAVRALRLDYSPSAGNGEVYLRAHRDAGSRSATWFQLRRGTGRTWHTSGYVSVTSTFTSSWSRLGFESHHGTATYDGTMFTAGTNRTFIRGSFNFHLLAVPYWLIVLLLAVPPALYLVAARRRRRRMRRGLCPGCGYDLRASTGRCPECGLKIRRRPRRQLEPEPAMAAC